MQPESGRIVYAGSDFLHPIRFRFSEEGPNHTVQNRPGPDLSDLVRFWANVSCPETSCCARITGPGSGRMQPARYQFPTFRLGCVLPQTDRIILRKTSLDSTGFWLTMSGLGQTDPVRKSTLHFKTTTRFDFDYNVFYVNMFQEPLFLSSSSSTSSSSPSSSSSSSSSQ